MQVGCSGRKDSCLRFDEAAQQWSHAHRRTFLIFGYVDGFGWCEIEISTHSLIGWAVFLPKVFWTYLSHELRSDVHQALAIHVEIIHYADSTVWSGPGKSQGHPVIAKTALAEAYCECLNSRMVKIEIYALAARDPCAVDVHGYAKLSTTV